MPEQKECLSLAVNELDQLATLEFNWLTLSRIVFRGRCQMCDWARCTGPQ